MSHWLDKIMPSIRRTAKRRSNIPEGLWRKCAKCDAVLYKPELERALHVCPKCDHHMRINARKRLDMMLDAQDREELGVDVEPVDCLRFKDTKRYKDRLTKAQKNTDEKDALIVFKGTINKLPVCVAIFEFDFMGGSMGCVVGEKFVIAANTALEHNIPLICFSASGGARMQEALFSLMQMARTAAALERLKAAGIPYISVMTDPVYGGVSASLAMLGDINIAEPNALIGFAGPRVIEQTVREKLPDGFQRSEFLLEHGVLDMIVHRAELKQRLARLLAMLGHKLPSYDRAFEHLSEMLVSEDNVPHNVDAVESSDALSETEQSSDDDNDDNGSGTSQNHGDDPDQDSAHQQAPSSNKKLVAEEPQVATVDAAMDVTKQDLEVAGDQSINVGQKGLLNEIKQTGRKLGEQAIETGRATLEEVSSPLIKTPKPT